MKRERLTDRQAAERPAVPWEGTEHPGDKGDPSREEYEKGDPSAWAEDPREPPYPKGEHPAYPDEGTEHPAAKEASMRVAVEQRAAKCVRMAQAMFKGLKVEASIIEDQALEFMDLGEARIKSALERLEAGGFLADELDVEMDEEAMLSQMLDEEAEVEVEDPMACKFAEMEAKIADLEAKIADQNKPDAFDTGFDVSDSPKQADDDECEGCDKEAEDKKEALLDVSLGHNVFDEYDLDGDGFITAEEWGGSPAVFAAIDSDGDGIITVEEAAAGLGDSFSKFALKKAEAKKADDDEVEEEVDASKKAEEKEEEKEDEGEKKEAKKADDDEEDDSDDSDDDSDDDDGDDKEGGKKAADEEEKEEEGEKKEAMDDAEGEALIETMAQQDVELDVDISPADDPMGLDVDVEEDAELAALYGMTASDDEEEEGKEAAEQPQPKKASDGVKSLGSVPKTASDDVEQLQNLWDEAPDVSDHF